MALDFYDLKMITLALIMVLPFFSILIFEVLRYYKYFSGLEIKIKIVLTFYHTYL